MPKPKLKLFDLTWVYDTPAEGHSVAADPSQLIPLHITSTTLDNVAILAESYNLVSGSVSGPAVGSGSFRGSGVFTACLYVGSVHAVSGGGNNKELSVRAVKRDGTLGTPNLVAFEAYQGSIACADLLRTFPTSHRCEFCHSDQPVPVALSLELDSPAAGGAGSDRPTTLRHSGKPGFECCWLSEPLDRYSDDAGPALWMLRKTDARTWALALRRGDSDIVSYSLNVAAGGDCSFPIRLEVAGGAKGEGWPRTVTVSPAP